MGHDFERSIFDIHVSGNQTLLLLKAKKRENETFQSSAKSLKSKNFLDWLLKNWLLSRWSLPPNPDFSLKSSPKALFSLRIFWNHLSNKGEVKSSTKALHPSHFSESFVTSEVWLGEFLQTQSRGKNQPDLTLTNLTLVAPWQVLS